MVSVVSHLNYSFVPAVEGCKLCLERIEKTRYLNAFVNVFKETALKAAYDSDRRTQNGKRKSKLDGSLIAVKDNFCTYNEKTTCASRMLENFIAPYDATVVKRLKENGAIIIGKTNLDEFAMGSGTVDSIFGPTKNVWGSPFSNKINNNLDNIEQTKWRIAGGSSGGSAVAVATGACFAGIGSDTGGSVRNPASYCGVVGFKPTYGVVSRCGLIPLVNSMDVPAVLARNVEDVSDVFNVIRGPDNHDSTTIREVLPLVDVSQKLNLSGITVGIPKEYNNENMSPDVLRTWQEVTKLVSDSGATVKEVSMPYTAASIVTYSILNQCEVASNMSRYSGLLFGHSSPTKHSTNLKIAQTRKEGFGPVVRSRILSGNYFLLQKNYEKYFVKAMKVRRLIADDFKNVWSSGVNFLLTPTTLTTAPFLEDFISFDNRTQCAMQDYCTQPANMAGCPAVSIPVCLSSDGLPVSLQLMAPNFQDNTLLTFARWIESAVSFPFLPI